MLEKFNTLMLASADAWIIGIGAIMSIFGVKELIKDMNWLKLD